MNYKSSMFNRIVINGDELILYNAGKGVSSIRRVDNDKSSKVANWLSGSDICCYNDPDFEKLKNLGYIISDYVDEKAYRDVLYMEHLSDNRLHLVVHTTQACNFRCKYCYMDFKSKMIEKEVQDGIINFIRKNIQKYKGVQISWFGGEPLLNMQAISYISKEVKEICKSQKKPYTAIVTTNGYYLTPDNIDTLLSCNVTHIAVTVDGIKEKHDSLRVLKNGQPTFDTIISNLIYIRDYIKTRALTVSIRSNLTKAHLKELGDYYRFYNNLFGHDSRFSLFIKPVSDYGGEIVHLLEGEFIKDFDTIYDQLSSVIDGITFRSNFIDLEIGGTTCTAKKFNKFTIGCDGSVHKCDEDLDCPIGKLYANGEMKIDSYKHADWLCIHKKEECDNCFFSGSCFMEICPKARVTQNFNNCSIKYKEIDALIRLAAKTYNVEYI